MVSILVVDDSATERIRVPGLLSREGDYTITTAGDGKQALACLAENPVDLVLTDLQMPEMDGLELVREIRARYAQIPVILMTGVGSEEIAVQAMKDGAASYVSKISTPQWLCENVERVLGLRAAAVSDPGPLRGLVSDRYRLKLPSDRSLMPATSRLISQSVRSAGLCQDQELPRIGVAMEEALLNACLHGNLELDSALREGDGKAFQELANKRAAASPWKDRHVVVNASITSSRMEVEITDEGPGFNPAGLPDPTDPENLLKPHGRGVMMMRLFLDEVHWNDRGNQVTLIKNGPSE